MKRSLRTQIVGSTVLLAAVVLVALVAVTQAVLGIAAHREITLAEHAHDVQVASDLSKFDDHIERDAFIVTIAVGVLVGGAALLYARRQVVDPVARAILAEQRLTAELAHELRTPLTAVRGSAEVALMRPEGDVGLREDLEEIAFAAQRMDQVITSLLGLVRDPEQLRRRSSSRAVDVFARVSNAVPSSVRLDIDVPDDIEPIDAPEDLVVRALSPLVENAVRHASSSVVLQARATRSGIELAVIDDGLGVDSGIRAQLFDVGASGQGGTGLGLGIARSIASSIGGDVDLSTAAGNTRFVLILPRG